MLSDEVRMEAFRAAIRAKVRPGDVVLDAGTGTGVLAVLAALAGASRVYAVERSKVINVARRLAAENGCAEKIKFIQGDVREISLPEKADGVTCEMLGFCGMGEGIENVLGHIRENKLKSGGWTLPRAMKTFIAPISDRLLYSELFMEGAELGMSTESLKDEITQDLWIWNLDRRSFAAEPRPAKEICFETGVDRSPPGGCVFALGESREIHGIGSWFEAELAPGISINTAPGPPFTHWSQSFFPFRHPIRAEKGDTLHVSLNGIAAADGDFFNWTAELRTGENIKEVRTQSNTLSYHYLPD